MISILTTLLQVCGKMLYLLILAGNMAPKMQSGRWEGTRGDTPELGILTTHCEMEDGGGGDEGIPFEHTYGRICVFVTPFWLGVGVVPVS